MCCSCERCKFHFDFIIMLRWYSFIPDCRNPLISCLHRRRLHCWCYFWDRNQLCLHWRHGCRIISLMHFCQVYIFSQLKYLSSREALLPLVADRWLLTVNGAVSTTQWVLIHKSMHISQSSNSARIFLLHLSIKVLIVGALIRPSKLSKNSFLECILGRVFVA